MDDTDLEKGQGNEKYGDQEFDRALNTTQSSIVLNPARASNRGLETNHVHSKDRPEVDDERSARGDDQRSRSDGDAAGVHANPVVEDLDPAADRLARDLAPLSSDDFYSLMGMRPASSPADSLEKLALPHGLYHKIYSSMRYNNNKFRVFDILQYLLLFLQIVISAIFIILGALQHLDSHLAIAVLGAVATVIAGGLALMKGQGLPNRLRQTRDSLRNVMFEAEELYWDFRSRRPVLYKDVKKIRQDYLKVLDQARKHHPDAWSGTDDLALAANRAATGRARK